MNTHDLREFIRAEIDDLAPRVGLCTCLGILRLGRHGVKCDRCFRDYELALTAVERRAKCR